GPDVQPRELLVICQALIDQRQADRVNPLLWRAMSEPEDSSGPGMNLGAAGALVQFRPEDPRWADLATPLAAALAAQSDSVLDDWWEVFRPVRQSLVGPLRELVAEVDRPREHALAFRVLFEFAVRPSNRDRDRDLVAMIPDATPGELTAIRRAVNDRD